MKGPLPNNEEKSKPSGKSSANDHLPNLAIVTSSNFAFSVAIPASSSSTLAASTNGSHNTVRERNAQLLEEFLTQTGELIDTKLRDFKLVFVETMTRNQVVRHPFTRLNKFTRFQQKMTTTIKTTTSSLDKPNQRTSPSNSSQNAPASSIHSSNSNHLQNNELKKSTENMINKRKKSPKLEKNAENGNENNDNGVEKKLRIESPPLTQPLPTSSLGVKESNLVESTAAKNGKKTIEAPTILNQVHHQLLAELSIETMQESATSMGVVLTWDLVISGSNVEKRLIRELPAYDQIIEDVKEYQIYGCQGTSNVSFTANTDKWILIGTVDRIGTAPPIKCTLTDFLKGCTYHFAIRIKFNDESVGKYSAPQKVKL